MNFLQYLQEEWVSHIKGDHSIKYSGETNIFVNPTAKELRELKDDVRFVVDLKRKKLYVWSWDVVHYEVVRLLYKEGYISSDDMYTTFWKTCFAGVAEKAKAGGTKLVYTKGSDYCKYVNKASEVPWLTADDRWLNRWFGEHFIENVKIDLHWDTLE